MAHPEYIRQKAIRLRLDKQLSIDEIAERLALSKTTIYYWVKDLPLGRERRWSEGQKRAYQANRDNAKRRRDAAYAEGVAEFGEMVAIPTFLDFVVLYIAEGYKRRRNTVSIANSDPLVIRLASHWMRRLSTHKLALQVQHHADQAPETLKPFWSAIAGVPEESVRCFLKSNSGQLRYRTWRCEHGVASITVHDTLLRARLSGWIDQVKEGWKVD